MNSMTNTPDALPDPVALAAFLAIRGPHLGDLDPAETPTLCQACAGAFATVAVVYLEYGIGVVHDAQVWTDATQPSDVQAVALAGAQDALHDPHGPKWAPHWQRIESGHETAWLLRVNVLGSRLLASNAAMMA